MNDPFATRVSDAAAAPRGALAAAFAGLDGAGGRGVAFGPIGGEVEQPADVVFLGILAFSMGLLNAAVASSTNSAVRITHMTGPTTDLGVHLATAWLAVGDDRIMALRHAALRATKLIAFIAGAALMGATIQPLGYLAFLMPAVAIVLATLVSFVPREVPRSRERTRLDAAPSAT